MAPLGYSRTRWKLGNWFLRNAWSRKSRVRLPFNMALIDIFWSVRRTSRKDWVENLSPALGRGIDSRNRVWNWVAKLHRLAGRYNNPMPTWFLAPIAGLKLPTLFTVFSNWRFWYDLEVSDKLCKLRCILSLVVPVYISGPQLTPSILGAASLRVYGDRLVNHFNPVSELVKLAIKALTLQQSI